MEEIETNNDLSETFELRNNVLNENNISQISINEELNITPSSCGCGGHKEKQLIYAIGNIHFDFENDSQRDSFKQYTGNELNNESVGKFLKDNPADAETMTWLLTINETPIYAIKPQGAFASDGYSLMIDFFNEQSKNQIERIALAGVIDGMTKLNSGSQVPTIRPTLRGCSSWSRNALIDALVTDKQPSTKLKENIGNFLSRVYFELQNTGNTSNERALNYAATNLFQTTQVFNEALKQEFQLDNISVLKSKFVRPDKDLWDVQLTFFNPKKRLEQAKTLYSFMVDCTDVLPTTIGEVRSWSTY